MNIAVYCSSRQNLQAQVYAIAQALGRWIGQNGHTLVYGGVDAGLMHTVAQATHENGGHIIGVVPAIFADRADKLVDEIIESRDLNDRKGKMVGMCDAFVVLPGGIGTIDEWISTLSQIVVNGDNDRRHIVVVNHEGMYDHTLRQIEETAASTYSLVPAVKTINAVATNQQQMIEQLNKLQNNEE